eukprot:361574-Chlamydomonas_euryale.AAC.7
MQHSTMLLCHMHVQRGMATHVQHDMTMGDGHDLAEPLSQLHPYQHMLCNYPHHLQFTDNFVPNSACTLLKDVTISDKAHASTCSHVHMEGSWNTPYVHTSKRIC